MTRASAVNSRPRNARRRNGCLLLLVRSLFDVVVYPKKTWKQRPSVCVWGGRRGIHLFPLRSSQQHLVGNAINTHTQRIWTFARKDSHTPHYTVNSPKKQEKTCQCQGHPHTHLLLLFFEKTLECVERNRLRGRERSLQSKSSLPSAQYFSFYHKAPQGQQFNE